MSDGQVAKPGRSSKLVSAVLAVVTVAVTLLNPILGAVTALLIAICWYHGPRGWRIGFALAGGLLAMWVALGVTVPSAPVHSQIPATTTAKG